MLAFPFYLQYIDRDMEETALAKYMEITGISGNDLARKIGVSVGYISLIKHGHRRPRPDIARRICEETGITLEKLLYRQRKTAKSARIDDAEAIAK